MSEASDGREAGTAAAAPEGRRSGVVRWIDYLNGFKDAAIVLATIIGILATAVGGLWALYQYKQEVRRQESSKYGNMALNVVYASRSNDSGAGLDVYGRVSIQNIGNRSLVLNLGKAPLTLFRLKFGQGRFAPDVDDKAKIYTFDLFGSDGDRKEKLILAQSRTMELPFVFRVPASGYYLLSIEFPVAPEDWGHEQPGADQVWAQTSLVVVGGGEGR